MRYDDFTFLKSGKLWMTFGGKVKKQTKKANTKATVTQKPDENKRRRKKKL